jgi:type I restriction enzyme R subunit
MDIADFASHLHDMLDKKWTETIKILQNEGFLNLCDNYHRPKRVFIIAESAEDFVTSEVLFRAADGRELKPPDYIRMFEEFVKNNPEHIDALEILLSRPKDFDTLALSELKKQLSIKPSNLVDKFSERNLRRAYHYELADIVSIIKHASKGDPLLSSEERIDRALESVKENIQLTEEQEKWLGLIREHLVKNILIDKEDIDMMPIFSRKGMNYQRMNMDFDGKLSKLLYDINQAVLS